MKTLNFMSTKKPLILAPWMFVLSVITGCSEQVESTPTYQVGQTDLIIEVPALGELEAAEAEVISNPSQQPMTLAWMEQEFIHVKKGQVIARFDAESLTLQKRKEQLEMELIAKDMQGKYAEKSQQEAEVNAEKDLVSEEFEFSQSYSIDDLRIYSQLEIIESMENTEFLNAKDEFLDWKKGSISEQSQSAVDVLNIRKEGHAAQMKRHESALKQLEVVAPFDGLLVYTRNWRGEKPVLGQSIFPGNPIARIPNLQKMQAKLYVLEKQAIGLEEGQNVALTLDAFPDQKFSGKVKQVAAFARTIERGNPVKYYDVTVELQQSGDSVFRPGRKLSAKVSVNRYNELIKVPIQAIHNENEQNFVYKKQGDQFVKQVVQTGNKNLYFVEISQGLQVGDKIALSQPELSSNG
ncbi:efflux RND transporter periplasmic adaptor subunit [Psychrosphaera ytuae]|nr:efflux RND transporter periplasmic adaptor subunit [Psychrosphaera ytuae]